MRACVPARLAAKRPLPSHGDGRHGDRGLRPPARSTRTSATTIRQIARERIAPRAAEIDAHRRVPVGHPQAARRAGHPRRCRSPRSTAAPGTGTLMLQMAVEEIAKACASSALILMVQELGTLPIQLFGSDELKERFLPRCATRRVVAGVLRCPSPRPARTRRRCARPRCATATSGSSTARRTGSRTPGVADFYVVFAVTDRENRRITAFVVEKDRPGFSIGKLEHKLGIQRLADRPAGVRGRARAGRRT